MHLLMKSLFASVLLATTAWAQPCAPACSSGQGCGPADSTGFYQAQYAAPPTYNGTPWMTWPGAYQGPQYPFMGGQQGMYYNPIPFNQPYAPYYPGAQINPLQVVGPLLNGLLNR